MVDFGSIYARYAADLFRFALYLSGNRGDAEDITSETFVRAWVAQDSIAAETVKGYLFTIAKNLFLQGLRRAARPRQRPFATYSAVRRLASAWNGRATALSTRKLV